MRYSLDEFYIRKGEQEGWWETTEFDEEEGEFYIPFWLGDKLRYELFISDDLEQWEGQIIYNIAVGLSPHINTSEELEILINLFNPKSHEGVGAKKQMVAAVHRYASWLKEAFTQELRNRDEEEQNKNRCVLCQASDRQSGLDVCANCRKLYWREHQRLRVHLHRAEQAGQPATLTLGQWVTTLHHYHFLCAYCQLNSFEVLEHFVPLPYGGTTEENCVPACRSCNVKKQNKNPAHLS